MAEIYDQQTWTANGWVVHDQPRTVDGMTVDELISLLSQPFHAQQPYVSAIEYGALLDGLTDDTATIQAALDSGRSVTLGGRTARITSSLYMKTGGQGFAYGTILFNAALGIPALYLGATDASGTPPASAIISPHVDLVFQGNGVKAAGSAGLALVAATTSQIRVKSWGFESGLRVLGRSLVNSFMTPDLRYNTIGFNDPSTDVFVSDIQGSTIFGGRIEANEQEGVVLGSPNVKFVGTIVEGNGQVSVGGDGTRAEFKVPAGTTTSGTVELIGVYMETVPTKTVDCMILLEGTTSNRFLLISGGSYYAQDAANRYIVRTNITTGEQAIIFRDCSVNEFKNYVAGTISGNSKVVVDTMYSDASRLATNSVTAINGASVEQHSKSLGQRTTHPISAERFNSSNDVEGANDFNGRKVEYRESIAVVGASMTVAAAARFAAGAVYAVEIVLLARSSSTASKGAKLWALVNGASGVPVLQASGSLWNDAAGSPVLSIDGSNNLIVSGLSSSVYDAFVTSYVRS